MVQPKPTFKWQKILQKTRKHHSFTYNWYSFPLMCTTDTEMYSFGINYTRKKIVKYL